MPPTPGTSQANLSQTPSSTPGNNPSWYNSMLSHLSTQPTWPADKESAILEPYTYFDSNPGKEVRTKLIEAFNVWLQVPTRKLDAICSVVRMLHTASLLMDDVEDNSDLRRGIPVAHKIYGVPQTINTANYVYFLVFSEIFRMNEDQHPSSSQASASPLSPSPTVERLVVDELINLHRGQGMDLLWRDSLICPTEEEYVEMQYAVSYMRNVTKSFDYTTDVLERLDTQAHKEIQRLEQVLAIPNPGLKAILDALKSSWKAA
ncbi:hypothetical protein NDA16_002724 [Ustilago loliicola]|nr:hypothetical protein NDA16_002724 [Ustilago loliicola]